MSNYAPEQIAAARRELARRELARRRSSSLEGQTLAAPEPVLSTAVAESTAQPQPSRFPEVQPESRLSILGQAAGRTLQGQSVRSPEEMGMGEAFARSVAQGATGLPIAAPTAEKYPMTTKIGELAGFGAGIVPVARAVSAAPVIGRALTKQIVGQGAKQASKRIVQRAGKSAADLTALSLAQSGLREVAGVPQTWKDVGMGALESAALGGVLGASGGLIGQGLAKTALKPAVKTGLELAGEGTSFAAVNTALREIHGIPTETDDLVFDFLIPAVFRGATGGLTALSRYASSRGKSIPDLTRKEIDEFAATEIQKQPELLQKTLESIPKEMGEELLVFVNENGPRSERIDISSPAARARNLPFLASKYESSGEYIERGRNLLKREGEGREGESELPPLEKRLIRTPQEARAGGAKKVILLRPREEVVTSTPLGEKPSGEVERINARLKSAEGVVPEATPEVKGQLPPAPVAPIKPKVESAAPAKVKGKADILDDTTTDVPVYAREALDNLRNDPTVEVKELGEGKIAFRDKESGKNSYTIVEEGKELGGEITLPNGKKIANGSEVKATDIAQKIGSKLLKKAEAKPANIFQRGREMRAATAEEKAAEAEPKRGSGLRKKTGKAKPEVAEKSIDERIADIAKASRERNEPVYVPPQMNTVIKGKQRLVSTSYLLKNAGLVPSDKGVNYWEHPQNTKSNDAIRLQAFTGVPDIKQTVEAFKGVGRGLVVPVSSATSTVAKSAVFVSDVTFGSLTPQLNRSDAGKEIIQSIDRVETKATMKMGKDRADIWTALGGRKVLIFTKKGGLSGLLRSMFSDTPNEKGWVRGYDGFESLIEKQPPGVKYKEVRTPNFQFLIEHFNDPRVRAIVPSEKILRMAEAYRKIDESQAADFSNAGGQVYDPVIDGFREFSKIENHWPRFTTYKAERAMVEQRGPFWDALVEFAKVKGFEGKLYKYANAINNPKKYGSLENARIAEMPAEIMDVNGKWHRVFETDPFKVIETTISGGRTRNEIIKEFGQDGEKFEEQFRNLNKENERLARKYKNYVVPLVQGMPLHSRGRNSLVDKALIPLDNLIRTALLSSSSFIQPTGIVFNPSLWGMRASIKSAFNNFRPAVARGELLELQTLAGFMNDMTKSLAELEGFSGVSGVVGKKFLAAHGYGVGNKIHTNHSILAAKYSVEFAAEAIRQNRSGLIRKIFGMDTNTYIRNLKNDFRFTDKEISDIVENGMSEKHLARVAQRAQEMSNAVGIKSLTNAPWMHRDWARFVFAFAQFPSAVGRMTTRAFRELQYGNVKPLTHLIFGGLASAELYVLIKNIINDRARDAGVLPEQWGARLLDDVFKTNILGVPGMIGESLGYAYKYGDGLATGAISPPTLGALNDIIAGVTQAIEKEEIEPLYKRAIRAGLPVSKVYAAWGERIALGSKESAARRLVRDNMVRKSGKKYWTVEPRENRKKTGAMLLKRADPKRVKELYKEELARDAEKRKEKQNKGASAQ